MTREQWLSERRSGIGASETPSILGCGFETAAEVWARKLGLAESPEETERMEIGTALQPALIRLAAKRLALPVVEEPDFVVRRHPDRPYVLASLDAVVRDADGEAPLDVKNVDRMNAAEWEHEPPLGYTVQIQQQCYVTGASHGYLFALIGGNRTVWHRVERNERFIAAMLSKLAEFWRLVETRTPPPCDDAHDQARVLSVLYPRDAGTAIALPDEAATLIDERAEIAGRIKELEAAKCERENELKAMLGDNAFGRLSDGRWVSWRTQRRAEYVVAASEFRVLRFHDKAPKGVPELTSQADESKQLTNETV